MIADRLFPAPGADLTAGLEKLRAALALAQPLRTKHRAELPGGIRRLSEWLTVERDDRPRDYMTRPEILAAYLHYYLPWNIYRQGRLLQGLPLTLPERAHIVDLGAGPLTFLLALWWGRPDLRERALHYLAVDRAAPALRVGELLWADLASGSSWTVHTSSRAAGSGRAEPADLLVVANLLNEIEPPRGRGAAADDGDRDGPLLTRWEDMCAVGGSVLVIEPGTRPAGRRLAALRQSALRRGWQVAAPCPHAQDCPQPGTGRKPWCHFTFAPVGIPRWLADLSRRAQLPKERASLSFLLLRSPQGGSGEGGPDGDDAVRVVSQPFALPAGGSGRYGCSARGLTLLSSHGSPHSAGPAPGDLLRVTWPARPDRDRKSGALIVPQTESDERSPRHPGRRGDRER